MYFKAVYKISFHEPWQGAFMTGKLVNGAYSKEEAESDRARYEAYYREAYRDPHAKVELVSLV